MKPFKPIYRGPRICVPPEVWVKPGQNDPLAFYDFKGDFGLQGDGGWVSGECWLDGWTEVLI